MAGDSGDKNFTLMDRENVDKLYHHFLRIDSNGNGVIDIDELKSLKSIKNNPLAFRLLEIFDTDKSGDIDFAEFIAGLAIFSPKSNYKTKLKFAFDLYDLDHDGYISTGDLYHIICLMTNGQLPDHHLQQIVDRTIRDASTVKEGMIDFQEFKAMIEVSNKAFVQKWTVNDL